MKLAQKGVGFLHILLILLVAVSGAAYWKYQQKKSAEQAEQQTKQEAAREAAEIALELQRLDQINRQVKESHRQELEIQRRAYASANIAIPVPDQSDLLSKSLPYLAWDAVRIDMSKAEIREFANTATGLINSALKDPDSAKFSDRKIFKASHADGSRTFICGNVNARNSFGGYTGPQAYVVYKTDTGKLAGGVGESGFLATIRSEGKWWRYDADDMCLVHGTSID